MGLTSSRPPEEQTPTAELPTPDPPAAEEPEHLTSRELEITTADTRPLPIEMAEEPVAAAPKTDDEPMESKVTQAENTALEVTEHVSGPLLDLGDFQPAQDAAEEDFVLDIDLDEVQEPATAGLSARHAVSGGDGRANNNQKPGQAIQSKVAEPHEPTVDPMAETQEMIQPKVQSAPLRVPGRSFSEPEILQGDALRTPSPGLVAEPGQITLDQLSPEAIDAIARRAVEMLSEKVLQEIAWEVVPQLAELMIKRQLEEKNS
jgi:hypothetical protein